MNLIRTSHASYTNHTTIMTSMQKYMFSPVNMKKGYEVAQMQDTVNIAAPLAAPAADPLAPAPIKPVAAPAPIKPVAAPAPIKPASTSYAKRNNAKPFTPFQKDKLFWCFYIILNGYEEYEMNHSNTFSIEKQLKIETVEKLKSIKEKLKELKLKRTELEDELVNKPMITLKGLCALCLVHNVSITYIYGRKYCEISPEAAASEAAPSEAAAPSASEAGATSEAATIEAGAAAGEAPAIKKGIIIQNERKEDSIKWTPSEMADASANVDEYLTKIREDYWLIENIQKPLKASSAYTLTDLQEICQKLLIDTHLNNKAKTKTKLYEEIVQSI
jgi:hypothetical protein